MGASAARILPAASPLVLTVTSGKGGVGKSQLAASLAHELRAAGSRVLLVDADVGTGNLALLFGAAPRHDLRDVLSGRLRPEQALTSLADPYDGGPALDLLPAISADRHGSELTPGEQLAVVEAVRTVGGRYDIVLVDTGAGVSRNPMLFASAGDAVLVVATPEPASIIDAYTAVKVLYEAHRVDRFHLVVNQSVGGRDARRTYARLTSVTGSFLPVEIELLAVLPRDESVGRAVRQKSPAALAYPSSPFTRSVRGLRDRLLLSPPSRSAGGVRFFPACSAPLDAVPLGVAR